MERLAYREMAATEDTHWWFIARRAILTRILHTLPLPKKAVLLEIGCGSGGNLAMLSHFGHVHAMEYDSEALSQAQKRGIGIVRQGALPAQIPFSLQTFDLIAMLDVLEHIDDDSGSLHALYTYLKPGGWLMLTVPAYRWLWSSHDVMHHHKRRYTRSELKQRVRDAGFTIRRASYFNTWLFPVVAAIRLMQKRESTQTEYKPLRLPPAWLNRCLTRIFESEKWVLPFIALPFGVSILLLAKKEK